MFFVSVGQGEYDIENWRMVYWRPQKGQLANPKFAAFCDSWEATKAKYPYLQEQAQGVKDSLASVCSYKTTSDGPKSSHTHAYAFRYASYHIDELESGFQTRLFLTK
jgi:hypothetical protein